MNATQTSGSFYNQLTPQLRRKCRTLLGLGSRERPFITSRTKTTDRSTPGVVMNPRQGWLTVVSRRWGSPKARQSGTMCPRRIGSEWTVFWSHLVRNKMATSRSIRLTTRWNPDKFQPKEWDSTAGSSTKCDLEAFRLIFWTSPDKWNQSVP